MYDKETEIKLFDDLSAELEDPALQRSLEAAKYWDEKLRSDNKDDEVMRATIQSSLAKSWNQWEGKPVTITGFAHRVLGEDNDIRPDPVLMTSDDAVISKGFAVIHTDVDGENIHGNPYGHQYRVVHELQRQIDNKRYERLIAFIDSHDVQSEVMSVEYSERWLGRTQGDFLNQVQDTTEKARRPETKLVRIGSSCEPGLFLDVFNKKNRAAVEAYINNVVEIDTKVPYLFTTQGGKSVFEDTPKGDPYETITTPLKAIGKFSRIYFQQIKPNPSNNGAGDWWLSVKATVHGEQVSDAERTMILPLRALKNVRSLRELGYGALQHLDKLS